MFLASLIRLLATGAVVSAAASDTTKPSATPSPSNPPEGEKTVVIQRWVDTIQWSKDEIEVGSSSSGYQERDDTAVSLQILEANTALGPVQCNVEINHGNYYHLQIPVFDDRFRLEFDKQETITGIKCYEIEEKDP